MYRLFQGTALAVFALCAGASPAAAQDDPEATGNNGALVSVKVIAVQEVPEGIRATLEILHVYYGPQSLKGLAFFNYTKDEFQGTKSRSLAVPLLKVGETGIWSLGINQVDGTWKPYRGIRKDRVPDYDQWVEWAATIEKLAKLEVPKRLKLAQELCGHKNVKIAQRGIQELFGAKPEDAKLAGVPEFLNELPKNRAVTHSALVCADRLLFARDGKKWLDSHGRKVLIERFTEPLTDEDAVEVTDHLVGSRTSDTWGKGEAAALLAKIATDPRQSQVVRGTVVKRVVDLANNTGIRPDFTFDILTAVVRRGADASRVQAAEGLAHLAYAAKPPDIAASYTLAQIGTLRGVLVGEKDAKVAKALESAINKSK